MKSSRCKAICLPFKDEKYYRGAVNTHDEFRASLMTLFEIFPELFPEGFGGGFKFHDRRYSKKLGIWQRRIKILATGETFLIRPSFIMPYGVA